MKGKKEKIRKKKVVRSVASFLLFAIFLCPSAIEFSHAFDRHEHNSCEEVNLHFHEKLTDCEVCDFNFTPFQFHLLVFSDVVIRTATSAPKIYFSSFFYNPFQKANTQLRAPPHFLV